MPDVEFAAALPAWEDAARPEGWRRVARAAEDAGFDAAWRGDHIVFPEHIPEGGAFARIDQVAHDVFAVLAFAAAVTDDLRLGTNVCVAPYRHPVHLAKLALTLDALSAGRFELGVGVGVHRSEFEVLDVPHGERGSRTDEFLELFERVIEEPAVAFDGPHHSFGRTGFHPRPVQDGGPPVWVGGESSAAIRRTAEFGVGWTTFERTPEELRALRERLLVAWDDYDRAGEPRMAAPLRVEPDGDPDPAAPVLTGEPAADRATVERFVDAGATRLTLGTRGLDLDRRVALLERIGGAVVGEG